ncbi:MAG: gliding motility lipoprotein GldB, partial [Saprospiraceae bacterium]
KKLYLLDKLLPHTPDHIKLGYSADQTEWCEANEFEIWQFLFNEDLLYSTDRRKYMKYVSPSPNSPGMPEDAPGRTANWIGWQIVKRYMKMNPNASIQDLIDYKDGAKLLTKTSYKGKS